MCLFPVVVLSSTDTVPCVGGAPGQGKNIHVEHNKLTRMTGRTTDHRPCDESRPAVIVVPCTWVGGWELKMPANLVPFMCVCVCVCLMVGFSDDKCQSDDHDVGGMAKVMGLL